jgi:HEPN domain-containing protein
MNRSDLQKISRIRLTEAAVLLQAGHYPGAYYLAGYSVECALKACIAKQTKRHEFPNRNLANKAWVHDLEELIKLSGLGRDLEEDIEKNKALELNWVVVKDWSESSRYDLSISDVQSRDFYSACAAPKNGILSWIKKRW